MILIGLRGRDLEWSQEKGKLKGSLVGVGELILLGIFAWKGMGFFNYHLEMLQADYVNSREDLEIKEFVYWFYKEIFLEKKCLILLILS